MADSSGQLLSSVSGNKAYIPWIKYAKDWYPICGHYFWDTNDGASAFCRRLGFQKGSRVHTREKYSKDAMPVGKCSYGQRLTQCSRGGNAWGNLGYRNRWCGTGKSIGVKIVCSGGSGNPSSCEKAPPPLVPGLKEERFYKITPGMRSLPNLNELGTPCDTKQVAQPYYRNTGSNWPSWPEKDNFAVRWTGLLKIRSHGNYRFWTYSDDGSKLWIDNGQVVNNDGLHGWRGRSGSKALGAGTHVFKAEMFERGGGAGFEVKYVGKDTGYRVTRIPSSAFVAK